MRYTDPSGHCFWDGCVLEAIAVVEIVEVVVTAVAGAAVIATAYEAGGALAQSQTIQEQTAPTVQNADTPSVSAPEAGADAAPDTSPSVDVPGKQGVSGGPRAYKPFTPKGKQVVKEQNAKNNQGQVVCEKCGVVTVPAEKSQTGVTPASNEAQVDHIIPRSKGGDGDPSNGQVLCRQCNRDKWDK